MSPRSLCRGISRRFAGSIFLAVLVGLAAAPAGAEVRRFFGVSGPVSLSVDAGGSDLGSHSIDVEKPSATATVFAAFVFAASHSFRVIADGEVTIDDVPIDWSGAAVTSPPDLPGFFFNVLGDVTAVVAPKVDAAPPGRVSFDFRESRGESIDGEVLAVVFEDPEQTEERMVWLAFGGSSDETDSFLVTLKEPIDPDLPGTLADFGLGISASASAAPSANLPVARDVEIDGVRITSAAGGEDDGDAAPGSRITAGGLDDSNANPSDPAARPLADPRFDDELYTLLPFFEASRTRYRVSTSPGEPFDNFFFAYFVFSEFAAIDAGIFLDPETAANEVGTEHVLRATAFDAEGEPAVGAEVAFEVVAGPNADTKGTATTDAAGVATFAYTGTGGAGVDVIEASFFDEREDRVVSNLAEKEWIDVAEVTLAPAAASRELGDEHAVVATVTGTDGAAFAGVTVDFAVTSGPNAGTAGSAVTGGDGTASFSYRGLGGIGVDVIVAAVTDRAGALRTSNEATVEWTVVVLADPRPDVAAGAGGDLLVVGEVGAGLFAVVAAAIDRDGSLLRAFTVNEETDVHRSPVAAALADGSFAVAFVAGRDAPNALRGRLVDADGPLAGVFTIAATRAGCDLAPESDCGVSSPAAAALPDGGFAVVWKQEHSIRGRFYDAGGGPAGPSFVVAAGTAARPRLEPAAAVLADGSLAVAYARVRADGSDEIRLARFDAAGERVSDVAASRSRGGLQANPAVAAANGIPFVFWESFSAATGAGIFARLDPARRARPVIQVNSRIAGDQLWPAATAEPSGLVTAVWLDAPRNRVAAQRLAPGLAYVGDELTVAPVAFLGFGGAAPVFGRPRLAALADGSVVVVVAIAGSAADPDGGVAVGLVDPSPLAECFVDGRLTCLREAIER